MTQIRLWEEFMENILDQLNDAQRAAVVWLDGPQLVIAGAGSVEEDDGTDDQYPFHDELDGFHTFFF